MKHVIVTGGSGFIGSHLCEALLKRGYAVSAIDNFLTSDGSNLNDLKHHPHFSFFKHDICEALHESNLPLLQKWGLHGILHFACPASPVDFDRIPFEILKVDSLGTLQTVDLAQKFNARYLLASTSEVYGDPLVHPQVESYWGNVNPIGPRACYDETKRFAEAYVSTATRLKGLNGGIVRIFNTYGPKMRIDDGRVVPELCRQGLEGLPLTIHGNGKQTRSFCFITDLVEGIMRLFESTIHEPVNLGNPTEYSVLDFAQVVSRLTEGRSPLEFLPARPDDPKVRRPDITRAKTLLGWEPQVGLEEGLELSLTFFRKQLS
ncbi:NAD-dependent epimerase/dehydratase family protein [bacterium]|jgi:dTDP-glucose 4,6-dehydratase|nr:NAD-dependent epimerase/dehydratase family protein [bacterium]